MRISDWSSDVCSSDLRDARYRAPEGTTTFSQYAQNQQAQQNSSASDNILPQTEGIKVMRDGDVRWLVVDQSAEAVYPKIIEFWSEQGFTIHSQDPRAGLMETDWDENRRTEDGRVGKEGVSTGKF